MKKTIVNVSTPLAVAPAETAATSSAQRGSPTLTALSRQYRALTPLERALWNIAYPRMQALKALQSDPDQPTIPTPALTPRGNGWTAYYSCNSALLSTQQPLASSPGEVVIPKNLPLLNPVIEFVGPTQVPYIALTPKAQSPYPAGASIAVWASPAMPQGNVTNPAAYRARQYVFLQTFDGGIPLTGLDITDAYLSVFMAVPAASRIAFKLMAINSSGFHSEVEYCYADTPMPIAAASEEDGDLRMAE